MNRKKTILGIILTLFFISSICGQNIEFKKYSFDLSYFPFHFSFDIPVDWTIKNEIDGSYYLLSCKPTHDTAIVKYGSCCDSLIFRVKFFISGIDTAIKKMGLKNGGDHIYTTIGSDNKIKIVVTFDITDATCSGLTYSYIYDFKNKGKKIEKEYEFIYFSNGKYTIAIMTNGNKLDEKVSTRIIKSFRFY